jgi:hypothetical protein
MKQLTANREQLTARLAGVIASFLGGGLKAIARRVGRAGGFDLTPLS